MRKNLLRSDKGKGRGNVVRCWFIAIVGAACRNFNIVLRGNRSTTEKTIGGKRRVFDVEDVPESKGTTTICLSCIDYRFVESIGQVLETEEDVHYYDPFSLAGASLGYNQTGFVNWPQTWLDTVGLAKSLHNITQIIVIEHMDCGMYRAVYGQNITPEQERQLHIQNIQTFKNAMASLEPTLALRGYLVYLDGHIERLI